MDSITRIRKVAIAATLTMAMVSGVLPFDGASPKVEASTVDPNDWRGVVNAYRAMSGLGAVGENTTWSLEGIAHSKYMLINGITHYEDPSKPGYTEGGERAGMNGNVAVTSSTTWTARQFVELWLTGPFHAIGVLRHNLVTSGYGSAVDPNSSRWRSGATLDVLRGIDGRRTRPSTPIVFPGRDVTTSLYRFIAETPNPVTLVGWSGPAGLPLIAMMPNRVTSAQATLTGPNGPVEVRVLHESNTSDATARSVLKGDNAVVVVPRDHLVDGRYTATISSNGGNVTWSFTVDRNAPLVAVPNPGTAPGAPTAQPPSPPAIQTAPLGPPVAFEPVAPHRYADSRSGHRIVRLTANVPRNLIVAGTDVAAVSANFTVDRPAGPGFLTVFNTRASVPTVSTLNFTNGPSANQMVVPVTGGSITFFSPVAVDVIVDLNGRFTADGPETSRFVPVDPTRIFDTRSANAPALAPEVSRSVSVRSVVPADATAVAVNVTAVDAAGTGYLQVHPGGTARPTVSNVNVVAGETRPNSAIVPIGPDGTIMLTSSVGAHVLVDVTGYFSRSDGLRFTALEQVRMLDTRVIGALNAFTGGARLAGGRTITMKLAGVQGVPSGAKAVSINVTAVDPAEAGFVSLAPSSQPQQSSTLNVRPGVPAVANGAMVRLANDGSLTIYVSTTVHILVDINGVWS